MVCGREFHDRGRMMEPEIPRLLPVSLARLGSLFVDTQGDATTGERPQHGARDQFMAKHGPTSSTLLTSLEYRRYGRQS